MQRTRPLSQRERGSGQSLINWIEMLETDASIDGVESPVDRAACGVAGRFPGPPQAGGQVRQVRHALVKALATASTLSSISAMFQQLPCLGV